MKNISKNAIIGYPAGIITGITYGLNPLFGVPLMKEGAAIESILFFRYAIAVLFLGGFLLLSRQSFKISWKQAGVLLILGLLYTSSSVFLFEAYSYIASGLATTIIFLYPVLVAIIMVFLRVVPSWPVLAFHHSHLCRGSDHDTERFYTDHQSDRSHPFVRFGFSLCTIYSHHQPKQNYQQYIKQPAYILCTDSRCNYLLRENYIIRHSYNNRTYRKHGLVEPCRSCDSSDCRINRYIGYCDTKHRSHQSIRPWGIRTRYCYSHWNCCLWRSSHNQYHCRNFTFHSSHNLYDCQNKKIGSGL